jgi:hypothetical protein
MLNLFSNGMNWVLTVKAAFAALDTDRQWSNISSTNTSLVSSIPKATIARLSPTRIVSIPAASPTCPLGKSCAVIMVMGSSLLYIILRELRVTFFRVLGEAAPIGECELFLLCHRGSRGWIATEAGLEE